jgi:two-component system, OmpR family, alkaline phosphatase synthesis response regulator PhoP
VTKRVLIVEDDRALSRVLRDNLAYDSFVVECAFDGAEALAKAQTFAADLILLDLMLPPPDGYTVCAAVAQGPSRTPTIILTARNRTEDKVRGLELGADDYVTKPFALDELLARIHAVLRRTRRSAERLTIGSTVIDFRLFQAWRGNEPLSLTHREYELLRYLSERAGKVVTREELLRLIWGYDPASVTRTVDNFIARVRRKIEPDPRRPQYIKTAHGGGYCFTLAGAPQESSSRGVISPERSPAGGTQFWSNKGRPEKQASYD